MQTEHQAKKKSSRRMQIGSLILITFTVRCQSGENGGNLQV